MDNSQKSWDSWREHVLAEIKRANDNLDTLAKSQQMLHIEIARLQIKSGIWGLMGGVIVALAMKIR